MKTKEKIIRARVSRELYDRLQTLSEKEDLPHSHFIRKAVVQYLDQLEEASPPKQRNQSG
jgi:predicted DNA-binding protein